MSYIHGKSRIIPGLERELPGMKAGEEKKVMDLLRNRSERRRKRLRGALTVIQKLYQKLRIRLSCPVFFFILSMTV
jgi:hypothetical protein